MVNVMVSIASSQNDAAQSRVLRPLRHGLLRRLHYSAMLILMGVVGGFQNLLAQETTILPLDGLG